MYFPFRQMECTKHFISRPHSLPLFPVHRTDSVAKPFVRGLHQASHVCVPVVVDPPSRIFPEFLFPLRVAPLVSPRSEEHTSELQSRFDLVCRLLLEKKY